MISISLISNLRELCDKRKNSLGEYSESENGWLVGYPEGGLIEKYLSGNMAIAWRRAEPLGGNAVEDGFILQILQRPRNSPTECGDVCCGDLGVYYQKPLVLSQNIEFVNRVKNAIPSIICFCAFDRGSFDGGNPLFVFEHLNGSLKIGGVFPYGEMGVAVRFFAVARKQRGQQQIKRGSCRIDDCPNVSINERVKRDMRIGYQPIPLFIDRIRLSDNSVWALPLPGNETILQDWDLGLGPIDGSLSV
jgi:hypothetical protein